MNSLDASIKSNQYQFYGLVTLRFLIGWHFLYEGISKLLNPYWSSAAYPVSYTHLTLPTIYSV